jgi:hypothetical protein
MKNLKIQKKIQDFFLSAMIFFMKREKNQSAFAKKVDVPITTISTYISGKNDGKEEIRRQIAAGWVIQAVNMKTFWTSVGLSCPEMIRG